MLLLGKASDNQPNRRDQDDGKQSVRTFCIGMYFFKYILTVIAEEVRTDRIQIPQ